LRNRWCWQRELSTSILIAGGASHSDGPRAVQARVRRGRRRSTNAAGFMDRNLEILPAVDRAQSMASTPAPGCACSNMFPPSPRRPVMLIGVYVDRVLKRAGLTGLAHFSFYTPKVWPSPLLRQARARYAESGEGSGRLLNANPLPDLCRASRASSGA